MESQVDRMIDRAVIAADNWGWILAFGILSVLFGILTLFEPFSAFVTSVLLYGWFALIGGIFSIIAAFRNNIRGLTLPLALYGILGVICGILVFWQPGIATVASIALVAAWAIVGGLFQLIAAISYRHELPDWGWQLASGILGVIFGLAVTFQPTAGAFAISWTISVMAIIWGILNIIMAFRLKP